MNRTICRSVVAGLALSAAALHAQAPELTTDACVAIAARLTLPNTHISATPIAAGGFEHAAPAQVELPGASDLPAFCRVTLSLKPTADSDIRSEVWLPLTGWNGKYLQVGNGAWGGSIQYAGLAAGLRRGYATASTDTGHTGSDASFALGHPEKLIDFGYRAVHETAVSGKAIVAKLFGTPARFAYFDGCSGGGRQSFMEAQRYPGDFDGIIAGAPGYDRTDTAFQTIGMAQATHLDAESYIPPEKYPLIHAAAMRACDATDGLEDGLISEPMRCAFDPGELQCKESSSAACLTAPQVVAARKIYAPVVDPRTGERISAGLEPGSELHWEGVAGPQPHAMYHSLFRFVVFKDPAWDFRSLDVGEHLDLARQADGGMLAATSTDLSPFIDNGGKLLIYHGWADQNIPPRGSIDYYEQLIATLGQAQVDTAVRLFMAPGMGHCAGGHGPNEFDMLTVLEQWREHGQAPTQVLATQRSGGQVVRTRPLCPYPQAARYRGHGSTDSAENFTCSAP